jgi:acetyl-CoA C-acetyltransferase
VAEAVGASSAHTVRAEFGVLQTTPVNRAAQLIADGQLDVALVVGGEAKYRDLRAAITGTTLERPTRDEEPPDEVLAPHGRIISPGEIEAGLVNAPSQYALIENARRHADGQSLAEHAATVAELWARFNAVARRNAEAWNPAPMTADEIRTPGPANRPIAFPYNKWHNSQWNVDQAAAVIVCAAEVAEAHGVPSERWIHLVAGAESNHMVPVSERAETHRSPGFALGGARVLEHAGLGIDDVAHVDLYSCFPIAVRTQVLELGLDADRDLTVTGGMTFAGGPLNNYVLQSLARMVHVLRDDGDALGLCTAISGMITKQGLVLLSSHPPTTPYRLLDVTDEVTRAVEQRPIVTGAAEPAVVATYTVLFGAVGAERGVVVCDLPGGRRAIATTDDRDVLAEMTTSEQCGRPVRLLDDGRFQPA